MDAVQRKDLSYFKPEGWVAVVILLLCFWPCLFIPFLMSDCYKQRQVPVYGTPEQACALQDKWGSHGTHPTPAPTRGAAQGQQGPSQPAPAPYPTGGADLNKQRIDVVVDDVDPDGKPPAAVGYPAPSAPKAADSEGRNLASQPPAYMQK